MRKGAIVTLTGNSKRVFDASDQLKLLIFRIVLTRDLIAANKH